MFGAGSLFFFLGKLIAKLTSAPHLPLILGIVGALAGIWPSILFFRAFARARTQSQGDVNLGAVEVFEVTDPIVVKQEEYNDEGPIYYLDIGEGKIMFLCGQWMFDPHIVPDGPSQVPDDETMAFPSSHFRLHRVPTSGDVIRVENLGKPVAPVKTIPAKAVAIPACRASEIVEGSLEDLPAVLARFPPSTSS